MNAEIWTNMFQLGLPILEKILRPLIVYFFLVIGLRLAGKRELAQLNPFDLVVLLTLSNTVQNAIIGNDNTITGGVIGAATLLIVNYLVVRFIYSHRGIERFVEGDPDALIQNGKLLTKNLQKEMITITELQEAAHKQGFGSLEEIETAAIEPDGAISFSKKEPDPDQKRQRELVNHLEQITQELNELRTLYAANQGKK